MGKRYYCDYCDRSFADGAENRKKHLASVQHQKLQMEHYHAYKSASTVLQEESVKKPCRKFFQSGICDYGVSCKYSHYSSGDMQRLHASVQEEVAENLAAASPPVVPDKVVQDWVQNISKKKSTDRTKNSSTAAMEQIGALPDILANLPNLPPSLVSQQQPLPCAPPVIDWYK